MKIAAFILTMFLTAVTEQKNVETGKGNYTNEITTYEYNPKDLKIEVPIK